MLAAFAKNGPGRCGSDRPFRASYFNDPYQLRSVPKGNFR
jgi:hypothetical protein